MKCKNCSHQINWKGDYHLFTRNKKENIGVTSNRCFYCDCEVPKMELKNGG